MVFRFLMTCLFIIALPTITLAGPYRVIFGGAITEIDSGAPDSFTIGERVFGTYEFNTEPEWTLSVTESFVFVSRPFFNIAPSFNLGSSSRLGLLPYTDSSAIAFTTESIGTGPLLLMTESGFVAADTSSEISISRSMLGSDLVGGNSARIGNRGRFSNRMLPNDQLAPNTLQTLLGPVATGIELHLNSFDLSPALAADDFELEQIAPILLDPLSFSGLTSGVISYGSTDINGNSLVPNPAADVRFDIDTLRIVAIPEPATITLLLFSLVAVLATRRMTKS